MPWKAKSVVDERLSLVRRCQAGESMAALCREYGISPKTGYKFLARYESWGEGDQKP